MNTRNNQNVLISTLVVVALAISAYSSSGRTGNKSKTARQDWPMWGGSIDRNMVNPTAKISIDFEPINDQKNGKRQRNVLWAATLGSQTYGNPVISGGRVFVGTNNAAVYRPKHAGDRGCLLSFDEKTGKFLWQLTRAKLAQGRVNDWPEQGICSSPCVEKDRLWLVTNRAELMCLDAAGFHDGDNDGVVQDEPDNQKQDADIVWQLDMIDELGVFPHNLATSSPVVFGDLVYVITSNGVEEAHKQVVSPRSPSFIAVNKKTGQLVWESRIPLDRILHGQWSSPTIGIVNGEAQVYFAGGDGWLYALDAQTGKLIWRFDLNPKDAKWILDGRGTRNNIVSTPVFVDNSVVLGVGQDPDHGNGVGHLYRIDATKTGDVSPTLVVDANGNRFELERGEPVNPMRGQQEIENPNSAMIWHYGGIQKSDSATGKKGDFLFRRTMSTAAVHDGLVYIADLAGFVHCIDFETGKRQWQHDMFASCWGSPMVVNGRVLIGDEYGDLRIFATGRRMKLLRTIEFGSSIYSTPCIANGVLFIASRSTLYALGEK